MSARRRTMPPPPESSSSSDFESDTDDDDDETMDLELDESGRIAGTSDGLDFSTRVSQVKMCDYEDAVAAAGLEAALNKDCNAVCYCSCMLLRFLLLLLLLLLTACALFASLKAVRRLYDFLGWRKRGAEVLARAAGQGHFRPSHKRRKV